MSERPWREVGEPFFDRIGVACDRLASAGWVEIAEAIAGHTRARRGVIGRLAWPGAQALHIMRLADEAERLADRLEECKKLEKLEELEECTCKKSEPASGLVGGERRTI